MTSVVDVAVPTPVVEDEQTGHRISGLDAIRGFAVAIVVAFHAWPEQFPGGFVGVPVFFTLSGFLIVGLIVRDLERGEFSAFRFWERRIRRLLPASLCTLALVTGVLLLVGRLTVERVSDLLGALLNVTNFQQIQNAESYRVGTDQSPVLHYWSLSIEEQFYLLLPVVILVLRKSLRALRWTLAGLLTASLAFIATQSGDAVVIYYSTASRAAEILIGACLALLTLRVPASSPARKVRTARTTVVASVGALVVLTFTTSTSDEMYARGGLLLVALVSAALVHALPRSPAAATMLDRSPLGSLGRISYAVYLVHWPLLVGLRAWLGTPALAWTVLAVVSSVAIAAVSSKCLEAPIRLGGGKAPRRTVVVACVTVVATAFVLTALPTAASESDDLAARLQEIDEANDAAAAALGTESSSVTVPARVASPTADVTPGVDERPEPLASNGETDPAAVDVDPVAPDQIPPAPPVRYAMLGDSKALVLGLGMVGPDEDTVVEAYSWTDLWCSVIIGGEFRTSVGEPAQPSNPDCDWRTDWQRELALSDETVIDVAVADFGTWDIVDRRVDVLDGTWTTIEDNDHQELLLAQMEAVTAVLRARGVRHVAWMTLWAPAGSQDAEQAAIYNSLIARLAVAHPDDVRVIDFAAWLDGTGEGERLLPDGVHSTWDPDGGTSREIGERFLVDAILAAS